MDYTLKPMRVMSQPIPLSAYSNAQNGSGNPNPQNYEQGPMIRRGTVGDLPYPSPLEDRRRMSFSVFDLSPNPTPVGTFPTSPNTCNGHNGFALPQRQSGGSASYLSPPQSQALDNMGILDNMLLTKGDTLRRSSVSNVITSIPPTTWASSQSSISSPPQDVLSNQQVLFSPPLPSLPTSPPPKQYPCPHCPKVFSRPHNLKSHSLIHTDKKPFRCTQCGLRFRRNHDLRRHMRLHSGVKPFKCTKCGKGFARSDALKRHIKIKACFAKPENSKPDGLNVGLVGFQPVVPSQWPSPQEPPTNTMAPIHGGISRIGH